jgi:2'-5' RNA ligase
VNRGTGITVAPTEQVASRAAAVLSVRRGTGITVAPTEQVASAAAAVLSVRRGTGITVAPTERPPGRCRAKSVVHGAAMVEDRGVPRMRLGVALLVPAPVAAEIDVVRRGPRGRVLDPIRMAAHLTLVPPVNVAEDRLVEAEALVRTAAAASRPIAATLGPPTTFLPANPVLHLEVGPPAAVSAIEAVRGRCSARPLARQLTWPFVPHVTLVDGGEEARILPR